LTLISFLLKNLYKKASWLQYFYPSYLNITTQKNTLNNGIYGKYFLKDILILTAETNNVNNIHEIFYLECFSIIGLNVRISHFYYYLALLQKIAILSLLGLKR